MFIHMKTFQHFNALLFESLRRDYNVQQTNFTDNSLFSLTVLGVSLNILL